MMLKYSIFIRYCRHSGKWNEILFYSIIKIYLTRPNHWHNRILSQTGLHVLPLLCYFFSFFCMPFKHLAYRFLIFELKLRWWQTRTQCSGHIVADTNVSLFACAGNICWGHKICVREKNVSDFFQKHILSATNVSPFARPRNIKSNNVSATMCPRLPPPLCS